MLKYNIPKGNPELLQDISTCSNYREAVIGDIISDQDGSLVTIYVPNGKTEADTPHLEIEYQIFKGLGSKGIFPSIVNFELLQYLNGKLPLISHQKKEFNYASLNSVGEEQDEWEEKYQHYANIENSIYKLNKG